MEKYDILFIFPKINMRMNKNFIFLIFSFLSIYISAQNSKNILFLGNSYTEVNNLPLLLKNMATSTGKNINYESNTPGGHTLQGHYNNSTSTSKIAQGNWDFVVLQEQSQIPSFPDNYVNTNMFPFAKKLDSLINKYNPCAETIFYMTWGRKNGDASNCATLPVVCTYTGMDDAIKTRYEMMANQNQGIVSPVGQVWRYLRNNHPSIELYSSDESHPSLEGSYAAACAFYTVIFRENPNAITFNSSLNATVAQQIRNAAKTVVFDQLTLWNVGKYDIHSNFNYSADSTNPLTIQFDAEYNYPGAEYFWTFGDGNTSNLKNPLHQYATSGNYTVELKVKKCGENTTQTQSISVSNMDTKETTGSTIRIYPNPTKDFIRITSSEKVHDFEIFSLSGRLINKGKIHNLTIPVQHLPLGNYILILRGKNSEILYQTQWIKN